jgi:hypothetical protein
LHGDGTATIWPKRKIYCDAIGRYDKLRMVIEEADQHKVLGLFEFTLTFPNLTDSALLLMA